MCQRSDLVAHERFFDRSQILQRRQKHVSILRATNILDKVAQLFSQCSEHLIFVFD